MNHSEKALETDNPYMHNDTLPIWIVPISGWGSEIIEEASQRMSAYNQVAKQWKINIEFSSRLGTFQSYKHAPAVAQKIEAHNAKTFAVYDSLFGKDWRIRFVKEVDLILLSH